MPIVIEPPFAGDSLSPGQLLAWRSDFIGPLPAQSVLSVQVTRDLEGTETMAFASVPTTLTQGQFTLWDSKEAQWASGQFALATGQPVHVQTQLVEGGSGTHVDSGTTSYVWEPSSNVGLLVQGGGTTGGGLTTDQALQLQQTQESTWPQHLVDALTITSLGTGSSSSPIAANLTSPVFGVIVRITSFPAELQPQTPDEDYWVKTLAVVRVFRGTDIWLRVPIHTSSKLINLWVEGIALGLADAVLSAGWLLNLSLQVNFLPGVTGQVLLMRVP